MSITDLNREQRRDLQRKTSGFKPERTAYRLKFEDPTYAGFVCVMGALSVDGLLEVAELSEIDAQNPSAEDFPKIRRLFGLVAEGLIEWNLLDQEDQPVPATLKGLTSQEIPLAFAIVEGWMQAAGGVPGPLPPTSGGGKPSEVASLPMDVESPNQPL